MANDFDTALIAVTPEFLAMFGETVTYKPLAAPRWVSPTSHLDSENKWTNPAYAYDGHLDSVAEVAENEDAWLEVILSASILCSAIRFYTLWFTSTITIDVHLTTGGWVNIAAATYTLGEWHQISFAAVAVDKARFKNAGATNLWMAEFEFGEMPAGNRQIQAIVNREGAVNVEGLPHGQGPLVTIHVANNAVTGISRAELDTGGDKVSLAWRTGGTVRDCAIVEPPLSEDAGMLELELR